METTASTNQQLADHIKKNLQKGYTIDSLRFSLLQQGYSRTSVEKAIDIANKQLANEAPKVEEKPIIKYEVINEEEMAKKVAEQDAAGHGPIKRLFKKLFG